MSEPRYPSIGFLHGLDIRIQICPLFCLGEFNDEFCALVLLTLKANCAAKRFNQSLHNRQPQALAFGFGGEERRKHPWLYLFGYADACVCNADAYGTRFFGCFHR